MVLVWLGLAQAAQTDCVTKDLTWRWLSTTADSSPAGAKAGDRWVHASTVVVADQAPGATGRVTWKADEATKVPFRTSHENNDTIETFKWNVTLTATDGKAIAADVTETELKLTMHCQRVTTGTGPAPAPTPKPAAAPAPAKAAPVPAPAKAAPVPAPAPKP